MRRLRRGTAAVMGLATLLLTAASAHAVEYRLLVANIYHRALTSFVSASELYDGAAGPGLNKLEQALDGGTLDRGVIVVQRPLSSVPVSIARAWGGVGSGAGILRGGIDTPSWDEVRWEGRPGERSIWVVRSSSNVRPQEIVRVVLKGTGPMRLFQPFTVTNGNRVAVLQLPGALMAFHESHGNVWDKYVAKNIDLRQGIGGVVGLADNPLFPDLVYLIVDQGDAPATFKAVITWRDRSIDRESPGNNSFIRIRYNH